jgi:3-hydroxyisobutyrate dehydrogenase
MGAGFVRAALARADGARAYADAADAVAGASRIHVTLADDVSVDAVLEPLAGRLDRNVMIIDHTTTAPTPTAARYARWNERGIFFAHVPMFMGPKNARESTGLMLVSGPPERIATVRPAIEPMTGKVIEVGTGDDRAAAFKLFGNMMLVFIVSGLADVFAFAKSLGISPVEAHALFSNFKPTGAIDVRGKNMADGNYAAAWELTMARKDVRLMLEEGARNGAAFNVLPHIAELFDRAIAAGHGSEDVGAVAAL